MVALALGVGALYLTWRLGWTRHNTNPWLFWSLYLAEITVWLSLARFAFEAWTLQTDRTRSPLHVRTVALAVIARHQPVEVIRAALVSANRVGYPHQTLLIDVVGRPELQDLAAEHECELRVDPIEVWEPVDAGLANVLATTTADLVAVLHADTVATPNFIDDLIGDFTDKSVWAAQGRKSIFGASPGEYRGGAADRDLFGRVLQPGKNHHGAALWSGDGSILRVSAVVGFGGLPSDTDTPVFELSVIAAKNGSHCTYHAESVVMALSTHDVDQFISQRALWARGHLQILRTRNNPAIARGLTPGQRLSFSGTLITYLSGPLRLVFVVVLCVALLTAAMPLTANPVFLIGFFALWMLLHRGATVALSGPHNSVAAADRQRWILVGAYCAGWFELLIARSWSHRLVQGAARSASESRPDPAGPRRVSHIRLLAVIASLVSATTLTRLLSATGVIELPPLPPDAVVPLVVGLVYLCVTIAGVLHSMFRSTRRTPRFAVESKALIAGATHDVIDLAEGGAAVIFHRKPEIGELMMVNLQVPGIDGRTHPATVASEVRWVSSRANASEIGHVVGLEFTRMSPAAQANIIIWCRVLLPASRPETDQHRIGSTESIQLDRPTGHESERPHGEPHSTPR